MPLHAVRFSPARLVMILRGFCQGVTTLHLSQEHWRRHTQPSQAPTSRSGRRPSNAFPPSPLPDRAVEADEMYQHAGEKGRPHRDPDDPPRRRALRLNGHGTFDNDRPPILGVIGRETGNGVPAPDLSQHREGHRACGAARDSPGDRWCTPTSGGAYDDLNDRERTRFSVNHNRREWARDDDGGGVREVHSNRIEGFWLGLRNYLRPFRGVNKGNLDLYLAFYQGMHNFRRGVLGFLRQLLRPITPEGT